MDLFSFSRKTDNVDDGALDAQDSAEAGSPRGRTRKRQKANEPVDPVLPEKQRARRRLVGAVALVLAAVIGLPMVLDPEPKPLAHDIAIDIPSKDDKAGRALVRAAPADVPAAASLDSKEELMTPDTGSAAVAAPAARETVGRETVARDATDGKAKEQQAAAAKAVEKPSTAPAPTASAASGTTTASAAPAARAPAAAPAGKSTTDIAAEEARVRALLAGKPDPAAGKTRQASDKTERYAVQVAALGSPEKVKELQNKLKAAGIQSYTQKVATAGGDVIRVRVGPVEGRSEAEKIRQKLVKLGLNGTLVPV